MSCDFIQLANSGIQSLSAYQGGKPIDELARELGLSDIVKLASNENPLGPSEQVLSACAQAAKELHRYPDGNGFILKQALSRELGVPVECLTLGNGSNELLDLLARVFLNEKTSAIYSEHGFIVYALSIQAAAATAIKVPAKNWGHDLPAMADVIREDTRLIYIANPNNPTGTWINRSSFETFMQRVPKTTVVVLDEAYCEYVTDADYPNGIDYLNEYANLVVTRTFSKAYGLAGLRVGYSISNPEIADLLNRVRGPFNVNHVAMLAATTALADKDYLAASRKINSDGMQQLTAAAQLLGLPYIPSVGNFVTLEFPDHDVAELYQKLLQQGVIVRSVGIYDMPDHLRVSIGLPEENDAFVRALGQVL